MLPLSTCVFGWLAGLLNLDLRDGGLRQDYPCKGLGWCLAGNDVPVQDSCLFPWNFTLCDIICCDIHLVAPQQTATVPTRGPKGGSVLEGQTVFSYLDFRQFSALSHLNFIRMS